MIFCGVIDTGVITYDADAQAFFDACSTAGADVTGAYLSKYNNTVIALKAAGVWSNLDVLFIRGTGNRTWGTISLKDPTAQSSFVGAYGGDFTTDQSFNGDGSAFAIIMGFNPGTYGGNFAQNDASFGAFFLQETTGTVHDVSSFASGFGSGENVFFRNTIDISNRRDQVNTSVNSQANGYYKFPASGYNWVHASRTASNLVTVYVSGVKQRTITDSSTSLINKDIGLLGAYDGSFVGGFFSDNKIACDYAGNSSLDPIKIMGIINTYFFSGLGTKAEILRQNIHMGDSMSGSVSTPSLSGSGRLCRKLVQTQGDGYIGVTCSQESRTLQSMVTDYTTEVQPYLSSYIDQDYIVWGGRNDLAIGGRTGTQAYNDRISIIDNALADSWRRVVTIGIPDTQAGFVGTNQAGYDAERATHNSLMAAEYDQTTAITNVFTSLNRGGYYIAIENDANFNDATDSTYFQADLIHPTTTLYDYLVTQYLEPTLAL